MFKCQLLLLFLYFRKKKFLISIAKSLFTPTLVFALKTVQKSSKLLEFCSRVLEVGHICMSKHNLAVFGLGVQLYSKRPANFSIFIDRSLQSFLTQVLLAKNVTSLVHMATMHQVLLFLRDTFHLFAQGGASRTSKEHKRHGRLHIRRCINE